MNAKFTLSALVLAAAFAGNALAETPTIVNDTFVSTQSRAEVQAELSAYKKAGVNPWSMTYNPLRNFQGTASRAEVTAAYLADRDGVHARNSEDSGSAYFAQHTTPWIPASTFAGRPVNAQ